MKFHFSQGSVNKEDKPLTYQESLMLDIQKTKCELENAYAGFDYVTDPDLIDCYIYEQNAVMKRYKYLLQKPPASRPQNRRFPDKNGLSGSGLIIVCPPPGLYNPLNIKAQLSSPGKPCFLFMSEYIYQCA